MTVKQMLQQIVEAEDRDERMNLVEENMALFEGSGEDVDVTEIQTALDEALLQLETSTTTIEELKQKYRDRFFGGGDEEEDKDDKKEENNEPEGDKKSLEELGY